MRLVWQAKFSHVGPCMACKGFHPVGNEMPLKNFMKGIDTWSSLCLRKTTHRMHWQDLRLATEICWQPVSRLLKESIRKIVAKRVTVGHKTLETYKKGVEFVKKNVQRTDLFWGYCSLFRSKSNSIHSRKYANTNPSLTCDEWCFFLKIHLGI